MLYRRSEAKAFGRKNMRGIWAAIPFPFTKTGELDEKGLRRDIRRYVDEFKIDGFFCGGLVGEFWALTLEERRRGQAIVVEEVAGKAQTMPHTGALSLRDTIALTRHAQEIGATYVVVGNPPMSTREPEDVHEYFRALAAEVDIGISLFNSALCGYSLTPEQVARLAEIENVFCIKNPQPVEHTDQVRRLVSGRIIVCDPGEARWLDNIVKHKDQVYMSSPDPYLLQTASNQRRASVDVCESVADTPTSPTASSSATMHAVRLSAPVPPCSAGSDNVRRPMRDALSSASHGKRRSNSSMRSRSRALGWISRRVKSRTVSRISFCSAVSSRLNILSPPVCPGRSFRSGEQPRGGELLFQRALLFIRERPHRRPRRAPGEPQELAPVLDCGDGHARRRPLAVHPAIGDAAHRIHGSRNRARGLQFAGHRLLRVFAHLLV